MFGKENCDTTIVEFIGAGDVGKTWCCKKMRNIRGHNFSIYTDYGLSAFPAVSFLVKYPKYAIATLLRLLNAGVKDVKSILIWFAVVDRYVGALRVGGVVVFD